MVSGSRSQREGSSFAGSVQRISSALGVQQSESALERSSTVRCHVRTRGGHLTPSAKRLYFVRPVLVWALVGYGGVDAFDVEQYPRFHLPKRDYLLLSGGPLSGARSLTSPPRRVVPSLWWPEDHAWFVRLDPDLDSTYVGVKSSECLAALTSTPGIEVIEARLSDRLDLASDDINDA